MICTHRKTLKKLQGSEYAQAFEMIRCLPPAPVMNRQIEIVRLRAATLFHIYFVGLGMTFYPFAIITGIAVAFGANTMKVGEVQVHGWRAILETIIGPPILAFFGASFLLLGTWPGLWLYSKFKTTAIAFHPIPVRQMTGTGEGTPSGI